MLVMFGLILMHILGDFYLQTNKIAKAKANNDNDNSLFINYKYLTIHSLLYCIPFISLFFIQKWYWSLLILFIIFISHWIIDLFTCWFKRKTKTTFVLLLDQTIHIMVLFLMFKFFDYDTSMLVQYDKIIYGSTIILFLIKPSIIFVDHIFYDVFKSVKESNSNAGDSTKESGTNTVNDTNFDIGSIIGVFERIIVIILCIFNAITAIAIIITVKTWARSNDIKTKEGFGNKYLVGTLASISLALIAAYAWNKLMYS